MRGESETERGRRGREEGKGARRVCYREDVGNDSLRPVRVPGSIFLCRISNVRSAKRMSRPRMLFHSPSESRECTGELVLHSAIRGNKIQHDQYRRSNQHPLALLVHVSPSWRLEAPIIAPIIVLPVYDVIFNGSSCG